MSGGSYDYLCYIREHAEGDILTERTQGNLRRMADRLTELGIEDAAGETEDLIAMIAQFERRVGVRLDRLYDVWRAVEWKDSGDSYDLPAALAKYRGEDKP